MRYGKDITPGWLVFGFIFMAAALALSGALPAAVFGQTADVQTDWAGGPGTPGPVEMWGRSFEGSEGVAWRSIGGQLSLSAVPRDVPLPRVVGREEVGLPNCVATADINGDGRDDVLSTDAVYDVFARKGAVYWWQVRPDGTWARRIVSDDFYGATFVNTADVDGDGDLDVLGAAYYGDGPELGRNGKFAWFENLSGDGSAWARHIVGDYFWGAIRIDAGDFDGDGDIDLVGASQLTNGVYEQDADIALFENLDGAGAVWELHSLDDDLPNASEAHAVDLDGDGDLDVVGANSSPVGQSNFHWWENAQADATVWIKRAIPGSFWGSGYLDVGDIDNDGDLDLIGSGYNTGSLGWWENLDGAGTSWQAWTVAPLSKGRVVVLGDVDGDGDLDALAASEGDGQSAWWIENLSGNGVWWMRRLIVNGMDSRPWIAAGDPDHDGKPDAVVSDEDVYFPRGVELAWFELTRFEGYGTLTGSILDGGPDPAWGLITWDADIPAGASLSVHVRASDDAAALGEFVTVPAPGTDAGSLVDPGARYLQYRLVLESTTPEASPVVRGIGINALVITPPSPGAADMMNSISASSVETPATVFVAYSLDTGASAVPGCSGLKSGLSQPVLLGRAAADADGEARFEFFVPGAARGKRAYFQAIERGTCTISNIVEQTFE